MRSTPHGAPPESKLGQVEHNEIPVGRHPALANPNFAEVGFNPELLTSPHPVSGSFTYMEFTSENVNFGIQADG